MLALFSTLQYQQTAYLSHALGSKIGGYLVDQVVTMTLPLISKLVFKIQLLI